MKKIMIDGIQIEIEKKRIKNMYLKILPPDARVHICAPFRMNEEQIIKFISEKTDWIRLQQRKMQQRHIQADLTYVSGEEVYVWGERYTLIVRDNSARNLVEVEGSNLYLSVRSNSTQIQREKVLNDWYRKLLVQELPSLIAQWESAIAVQSSGFTIRDMKTRWGTCNIRTKKICFNLQLAKKPLRCVEYVVVHELVHLLEGSHNHIFKSYMDQFLPQWRTIKQELNGNYNKPDK